MASISAVSGMGYILKLPMWPSEVTYVDANPDLIDNDMFCGLFTDEVVEWCEQNLSGAYMPLLGKYIFWIKESFSLAVMILFSSSYDGHDGKMLST